MTSESLIVEAIRELGALRCVCGNAKRHGHSFCLTCFKTLPDELRRGLWLTLSNGYPNAYAEAKEWLRINTKI